MVLTTANASFLWWNNIAQLYGVDGNNMLFPIIDLTEDTPWKYLMHQQVEQVAEKISG